MGEGACQPVAVGLPAVAAPDAPESLCVVGAVLTLDGCLRRAGGCHIEEPPRPLRRASALGAGAPANRTDLGVLGDGAQGARCGPGACVHHSLWGITWHGSCNPS